MSSPHALQLPATPFGFGLPGCWTLARDRAVTLGARQAGFLRIAQGAVWATLDGPHQGPANDWGDVVLKGGARIHLTPGQQVVLEPYSAAANEEACFSWEPDTPAPAAAMPLWVASWRGLRSLPVGIGRTLGRWLAPSHPWSPGTVASRARGAHWQVGPEQAYAQGRDNAWRTLYHLGINQP